MKYGSRSAGLASSSPHLPVCHIVPHVRHGSFGHETQDRLRLRRLRFLRLTVSNPAATAQSRLGCRRSSTVTSRSLVERLGVASNWRRYVNLICVKEACQVTTLFSWLSVDSRGPSSIYVVSDSRVTWGTSDRRWDCCRKVFATKSADIFGYCGEVLFPSLVLGQLNDLIDRSALWSTDCAVGDRHSIILRYLKTSFDRRHNTPNSDFSIIHCARDGDGMASEFRAWRIDYNAFDNRWSDTKIDVARDGKSRLLAALGTGENYLRGEIKRWNDTPQGETARAIFSAFCDALKQGKDPLSGGMPQLVSLDRRMSGKVLGFVSDDSVRYIYGLPVEALPSFGKIEWVDSMFQRVSGETLKLLSHAQRHARVEKPQNDGFAEFAKRTK